MAATPIIAWPAMPSFDLMSVADLAILIFCQRILTLRAIICQRLKLFLTLSASQLYRLPYSHVPWLSEIQTMTEKRKRGRPPGDGINDDKPLAMIAEMMVTRPCGLWAAVKEVSGRAPWAGKEGVPEACQRRWLRKWKTNGQGEKLLAATVEAHRERAAATKPVRMINPGGQFAPAWLAEMDKRMADHKAAMDRISEPVRQRMAEMAKAMDTPQMRAMHARMAEFANSPRMQEMQRIAEEMQANIKAIPIITPQQIYIPQIKPKR